MTTLPEVKVVSADKCWCISLPIPYFTTSHLASRRSPPRTQPACLRRRHELGGGRRVRSPIPTTSGALSLSTTGLTRLVWRTWPAKWTGLGTGFGP
jgi:hypothetical protein